MSDDDRQRRRLGDATRDRIANLADGWSVPSQESGTKGKAPPPPRPPTDPAEAAPTAPFERDDDGFEHDAPTVNAAPPPEALEVLRGAAARGSDATVQKSLTPMRAKPPPPPGRGRPTSPPPLPVKPAGTPAPDRGDPARAATVERDDPTIADPRPRDVPIDDATTVGPPETLPAAPHVVAGLRDAPRLPRRPGVLGDLRYVFTVVRGVRRARRDLLSVEDEITNLRAARAERLADLGRAAIADDRFDQTAIRRSRDLLADIEDRRSRHAGAAAAAEAEVDAIERAKEKELRRVADEIDAAEAEIARLDAELAPLERDAAAARKRATQVKDTLAAIDAKIAAARASLVSVKGPKTDAAAIEAELATLAADRQAVQRDEPAIAAELDALLPRIASLQASRAEAQARITAGRAAEKDALTRAAEQLVAVQARRRVEDRAAAEARTASEKALAELGERLYAERPDDLTLRLGAVEQQDLRIATAQRRAIELRELIGSVDRAAVARGVLYWVALAAAITTAVVLLV